MLSERTWHAEGVIRLLLGLFVFFFVGRLFWDGLDKLGWMTAESDRQLVTMIVGTLSFQGSALLLIALFLREQNLTWSQAFGFGDSRLKRAMGWGLLAGVVMVPVAWGLQQLSAEVMSYFSMQPESQELVKNLQESMASETSRTALLRQQIFFGLSVVVIAPVAEEMLFRGILYPTFKQVGFPKLGLWTTALIFAFLHNNGPSFVPFLLLAIVLVGVYELTDNLFAPILTHSFFNAANFLYLIYEEPVNRFLRLL